MNLKAIASAALFATLLASVSVVATTTLPGWTIAGDKAGRYTVATESVASPDGGNALPSAPQYGLCVR